MSANDAHTPLRGRPVLVTGASGYLGTAVVERLLAAGSHVTGTSRTCPSAEVDHWEAFDLRAPEGIDELFRRRRPEWVFHLGGITDARRVLDRVAPSFATNAWGTVRVLEACSRHGCRGFVHCGSMEAPRAGSAAAPASPYGASKWVGTVYAKLFQALFEVPAVILRPFFIYGPGRQPGHKLVPSLVRSYLGGERPRLTSPERAMDWVFIDDVADGFVRAACAPAAIGCEIDLGSGRLTSIGAFAELVRAEIGGGPPPAVEPDPARAEEVSEVADTRFAVATIGWTPATTLDEGVRQTVDWFRRHREA